MTAIKGERRHFAGIDESVEKIRTATEVATTSPNLPTLFPGAGL